MNLSRASKIIMIKIVSKIWTSIRKTTIDYIWQGQGLGLAYKMALKLGLQIWQEPGLEIKQKVRV